MLPSEVFLHLRLQFVRVLGLILTETRRGTACRSHLGVQEHVLEQAVRSLQTEGIESDAEFYRAFKAATGAGGDARSAEMHKAFVNAERSFSKNVSELRSKCNDKIRAELADQIPDVTGRRFNSYLVESNGQKDATACRSRPKTSSCRRSSSACANPSRRAPCPAGAKSEDEFRKSAEFPAFPPRPHNRIMAANPRRILKGDFARGQTS